MDHNIDIREQGRGGDGQPAYSDRRLYIQFLAFDDCEDPDALVPDLEEAGVQGALYRDVNNPLGIGLAVAHEDPAFFPGALRDLLNASRFQELTFHAEYTMLGRSYTLGYETDLDEILLHRPLRRLCNPELGWTVWYPLRRSGAFQQLPDEEKQGLLMEHGQIGFAFGRAGLAQDIRLACFGLDANDNDFVIGLLGSELTPLSKVVETMRGTRQTSEFIEQMGPFFVGRVHWQSRLDDLPPPPKEVSS